MSIKPHQQALQDFDPSTLESKNFLENSSKNAHLQYLAQTTSALHHQSYDLNGLTAKLASIVGDVAKLESLISIALEQGIESSKHFSLNQVSAQGNGNFAGNRLKAEINKKAQEISKELSTLKGIDYETLMPFLSKGQPTLPFPIEQFIKETEDYLTSLFNDSTRDGYFSKLSQVASSYFQGQELTSTKITEVITSSKDLCNNLAGCIAQVENLQEIKAQISNQIEKTQRVFKALQAISSRLELDTALTNGLSARRITHQTNSSYLNQLIETSGNIETLTSSLLALIDRASKIAEDSNPKIVTPLNDLVYEILKLNTLFSLKEVMADSFQLTNVDDKKRYYTLLNQFVVETLFGRGIDHDAGFLNDAIRDAIRRGICTLPQEVTSSNGHDKTLDPSEGLMFLALILEKTQFFPPSEITQQCNKALKNFFAVRNQNPLIIQDWIIKLLEVATDRADIYTPLIESLADFYIKTSSKEIQKCEEKNLVLAFRSIFLEQRCNNRQFNALRDRVNELNDTAFIIPLTNPNFHADMQRIAVTGPVPALSSPATSVVKRDTATSPPLIILKGRLAIASSSVAESVIREDKKPKPQAGQLSQKHVAQAQGTALTPPFSIPGSDTGTPPPVPSAFSGAPPPPPMPESSAAASAQSNQGAAPNTPGRGGLLAELNRNNRNGLKAGPKKDDLAPAPAPPAIASGSNVIPPPPPMPVDSAVATTPIANGAASAQSSLGSAPSGQPLDLLAALSGDNKKKLKKTSKQKAASAAPAAGSMEAALSKKMSSMSAGTQGQDAEPNPNDPEWQ